MNAPIYTAADLEAAVRRALEWAATVDWSSGREGRDIGPDCLTDWQRGLVTGIHEMQHAIRAASPDTIAKIARGE
ncbi:MAG: hypothetical protein MUD11_07455 [Rhodobacteraceae bacterium]|nr:hypothetical protein [Paracoccaceae bacterium]